MRWPQPLTPAEAAVVEDLFPMVLEITKQQMDKYKTGDQYKKLILAGGFSGAVDAVMVYAHAEKRGTPTIPFPAFAAEKIKLGVLTTIDNIKVHPPQVQSPPVAKRAGSVPNGNQRHL